MPNTLEYDNYYDLLFNNTDNTSPYKVNPFFVNLYNSATKFTDVGRPGDFLRSIQTTAAKSQKVGDVDNKIGGVSAFAVPPGGAFPLPGGQTCPPVADNFAVANDTSVFMTINYLPSVSVDMLKAVFDGFGQIPQNLSPPMKIAVFEDYMNAIMKAICAPFFRSAQQLSLIHI